jgi:hypothetical protein
MHTLRGMVQFFKEYFIFCLDIIATAKIHGISPKEDYSVCLFWIYTAFVGRYGDVVIILSQAYSAEIVFMMKEEKNAWNRKSEDLNFWTLNLCRQYHLTRVLQTVQRRTHLQTVQIIQTVFEPWRGTISSVSTPTMIPGIVSTEKKKRGFLSMQFCHQLCIVLLAHVKN